MCWIWEAEAWPLISLKETETGYTYRNKLVKWLDVKPINCGICLSFWGSLFLVYYFENPILISAAVVYKLTYKLTT